MSQKFALEIITKEKHGDIGECKMKMLAEWLLQWNNVSQKLPPLQLV